MTMAAYMLGTAVPAKTICTHPQCKTLFGALRCEVAFCGDGPEEWFTALDRALVVTNLRSSMRRCSPLRTRLSGVTLYSAESGLHGKNSWEDVEWGGKSQGRWSGT